MKLALSLLCENPERRTGLTTLFHEFVSEALALFPDVSWIIFAGPNQPWDVSDARVEVVRKFQANDRIKRRLIADHFLVSGVARKMGADALLTVGFVPLFQRLPAIMHLFSLQHLDSANRVGLARGVYRWLVTGPSMRKARLIISNSRFAASQILASYPAGEKKLMVSYEGLSHREFSPSSGPDEVERLRARFDLAPGYFLWISNFYPYKQAELLIEAYSLLDPQVRARCPLVMAGGDWNGGLDSAKARIKQLGLEENVILPGWIEDEWRAPLYRQALAFCLPSREETFGRCVTEAMACGTPCIVNDIAIMHEVTDGKAVLVDFSDREKAGDALRRLAEDEALRARLRHEGMERAAVFSFEKLTRDRILAIRNVLSGGDLRKEQAPWQA